MKPWWLFLLATAAMAAEVVERPLRVVRAVEATAIANPANPAPAVAAKPADSLEFANGDLLRGNFLSFEGGSGIKWRHDGIRETITVVPERVRAIRLLSRPRPQNLTKPNGRVTLVNGDRLAGTLVGMDEKTLQLETWYAGTLALPRTALRNLAVIGGRGELVFENMTSLDGWTAGGGRNIIMGDAFGGLAVNAEVAVRDNAPAAENKAWQFKDGVLACTNTGTIGRDVKLPPASNIEFDLELAAYPQFTLYFYTDAVDKTFSMNALALQFSSRYVYFRRYLRNGSSRSMSTTETTLGPGGKTKAHLSIRTDLERKVVSLFVDDALVRKWTDLGEANLEGTGLMLQQSGLSPTRISNLQVSKWDGSLDDLNTPGTGGKEDLATMKNGDKVSGQVVGIKEGVLRFKTSFAELQVPIERLNWLQFAGATAAPAASGAVRLQFSDQGTVTLKLERWDDLQVVGTNPLFGPVKFQPAAFTGLQFTPPATP